MRYFHFVVMVALFIALFSSSCKNQKGEYDKNNEEIESQKIKKETAKRIILEGTSKIPQIVEGDIIYDGSREFYGESRHRVTECLDHLADEGLFNGNYTSPNASRLLEVEGNFTRISEKYISSRKEVNVSDNTRKVAVVKSCTYELNKITGIFQKEKRARVEFNLKRSTTPFYCSTMECASTKKNLVVRLEKYNDGWRLSDEPQIISPSGPLSQEKMQIPISKYQGNRNNEYRGNRRNEDSKLNYRKVKHGNHVHYVHPNRSPDVSIGRFPTNPPGPGEYITPEGKIVEK